MGRMVAFWEEGSKRVGADRLSLDYSGSGSPGLRGSTVWPHMGLCEMCFV